MPTPKFGVVIHAEWRVLDGQPRNCVCTNASRGLSAKAELLDKFAATKGPALVRHLRETF